ncbi:MAG: hypothetical protein ACI82I_003652, partial [Gammaproteobacteria bacterium]
SNLRQITGFGTHLSDLFSHNRANNSLLRFVSIYK